MKSQTMEITAGELNAWIKELYGKGEMGPDSWHDAGFCDYSERSEDDGFVFVDLLDEDVLELTWAEHVMFQSIDSDGPSVRLA